MTKRNGPELTIEVNSRGVTRIIVETDHGKRPEGTALLRRILPALDEVSRNATEGPVNG